MKNPISKMTAVPKEGGVSIRIFCDQVEFSNWNISSNGRKYDQDEVILACLDCMIKEVHAKVQNKALLAEYGQENSVSPDMEFDAERISSLVIKTAARKV